MVRARLLLSLVAVGSLLACSAEVTRDPGVPVLEVRSATSSPAISVVLSPTTDPTSSQRFTWRTTRAYTGQRVEVVPAAGGTARTTRATRKPATRVAYSGSTWPAWTAEVRGLQAGTSYRYRILHAGGATTPRTFTTARQDVGRWRFLGLGDTQVSNADVPAAVVRAATRRFGDARLVLQQGDVVNRPYIKQEWTDLLRALAPVRLDRDVLVSIGNHEQCILVRDCESGDAEGFRSYFSFPSNGWEGQRPTWFRTDYQGVRFVVLDAFGPDLERQAAFLDDALASNDERWTVVSIHAGPFSARADRPNMAVDALIRPVLEKHDVDLVLSGHDHSYARGYRGDPDSTVYATSVAGSKFYDSSASDWSRLGATRVRWAERTASYQVIDVSQDELRYRAVVAHRGTGATPAYALGTTFDDVRIRKDSTGTKTVTW